MTHDFRDAEGFGFSKAESNRLGEAQHRWLDEAADRAVAEANRRKLGGFDDWTHEKLQAAQWVQHKARATGKTPADIMLEIGKTREGLRAKVFSEGVPSKELVGKMSPSDKNAYTEAYNQIFQNVDDQNALAQQLGLLSPEEMAARGDWDMGSNSNMVTDILADSGKGSDEISEWSKEGVGFFAGLRGLLGGQTDVAGSFFRKAGKVADINGAKIPFNRAVTEGDRKAYKRIIGDAMKRADMKGFPVMNYRNPTTLEVTWIPPKGASAEEIIKARAKFRRITKAATGGRAIEGKNSLGLMTYADEYKPSEWMKKLQNPKMRAAVEGMLPRVAKEIEEGLQVLPLTQKGKDIYQKTLQIIQTSGLKGVEDAVKAKVIPAAILGAFLSGHMATQQQPVGGQDRGQHLPGGTL